MLSAERNIPIQKFVVKFLSVYLDQNCRLVKNIKKTAIKTEKGQKHTQYGSNFDLEEEVLLLNHAVRNLCPV